MNKFYGTGVAIVTPFQADGEIDFNALRDLIEYLIAGGVEYIVSLGTTGESVVLTAEEKKKVWAFTAEVVNGRIDLVAGIGGNNTAEVVEQIKAFDTTGYDAILSASPSYNKPTQEGIYQHYKLHYVSTQYGGIGASIFLRDNKVFVSSVFEAYPAQKADVRAGDQIISINDVPLAGKDNDQVSTLLKGSNGTPVKLVLKREGEANTLTKSVVRDEIKQPNVSYSGMVDGNMGYIKLDKFLENSADEVTSALVAIKKNNPSGIILDLRGNGGGILQEAVKIVNLFVPQGVEVVSQKGKVREKNYVYKTMAPPVAGDLPLVVLINNRSASASEIVAGAIQDLDRGVVIGQRSYGKGLVQQTFPLPYNSLVKITIAKYYVPSGRCIQELDYAHRKDDGSVLKFADSLIHEFKTKGGRSVYDGSGIYPDISVKQERYATVTQTLIGKLLLFDYATKYRDAHPKIADAKSFVLSDAEYNDFVKYLAGKNYSYNTVSEKTLDVLKSDATKEKQFDQIQAEYDILKAKLMNSKKNDLQIHKAEIKQALENEIVSRYYFEKGRFEANQKYDTEMAQAVKTLQDKNLTAAVLRGDGNYKVIGKPVLAMAGKKAEDKDKD